MEQKQIKQETKLKIEQVAKILNCGMGRNKLYRFLREQKIFTKDNVPYARYMKKGYFIVTTRTVYICNRNILSSITLCTIQGVLFIAKLLIKNGISIEPMILDSLKQDDGGGLYNKQKNIENDKNQVVNILNRMCNDIQKSSMIDRKYTRKWSIIAITIGLIMDIIFKFLF